MFVGSGGMKISDVMQSKGTAVITIAPDETVGALLGLLAEHNIGAVVVSKDGRTIAGIVSERDVVRRLGNIGVAVMEQKVSDIMTTGVYTCTPDDEVADTAIEMTDHRIRHLPVIMDGQLAAIVSIGDIVKWRIQQLTNERDLLEGYINQ